jgi:hypothetical protein
MPAPPVTAVTVSVDALSCVALEAYPTRTPQLTIMTVQPSVLITLTMPGRLEDGHVRFASDLADTATRYAAEVEQAWQRQTTQPAPAPG